MAQAAVIIETPALAEVGLPIMVTEYDIQREINSAGAWAVSFPATQTLAKQVRSRWRVSIIEEGREGYLMRRGVVLTRNYRVNADGTGILTLAGYTRLYTLTAESTHFNLVYNGFSSVGTIANNLAGETVTVPASAATIFPKVTFSEMSKLGALLKIAEMARYNLRETFDEDGFELVAWDDVPDSGYRFVTVEHAGPELENAAANGMGLIAGTPTIGYDGKDLATRIIPIGVEFDGAPLELIESNATSPYTIQTGTNPDSSIFSYIEDEDATEAVGLIEMQYHRQDVRNPSNDAGTRLAAANALYKLTVGELQKRKSDVISYAGEIGNGRHIDALPGERVRIQFRGRARTPSGSLVWVDIDQDFLIVKRRDASGAAGVRGVSFTLAAPETPLEDPELPDAVPIPPPPRDVPDPPEPTDRDPYDDGGGDDGSLGPDVPPFEDPGMPEMPEIGPGPIAELPPFTPDGPNPYQTCCAPPTEIGSINDPEDGGGEEGGEWLGGAATLTGEPLGAEDVYLVTSDVLPTGTDIIVLEVAAPAPHSVHIAGVGTTTVSMGFWLIVPDGPSPEISTLIDGWVKIPGIDLTDPLLDSWGDSAALDGTGGGTVIVTPAEPSSMCVALGIRVGKVAIDYEYITESDMTAVPTNTGFGTLVFTPGYKALSGSYEVGFTPTTDTYDCGIWAAAVALRPL